MDYFLNESDLYPIGCKEKPKLGRVREKPNTTVKILNSLNFS